MRTGISPLIFRSLLSGSLAASRPGQISKSGVVSHEGNQKRLRAYYPHVSLGTDSSRHRRRNGQASVFPDQTGYHGNRIELNDDLDRLYILCMFLYDQLLSWKDQAPNGVINLDNF